MPLLSHGRSSLLLLVLALSACSAAVSPTPSATRSVAPEVGDPLAAVSWLDARAVEVNDVASGVDLSLIRADGSVAWRSELAVDPQTPGGVVIAPPRSGAMAFGVREGNETVVSSVRAVDGAVVEIGRFSDQVVGAAIDPSGETLYLALTGDLVRVVGVALSGGEPIELLQRPVAGRLVLTWDRLTITPDGRRIVLDDCIADGCRWEVIDVESGDVTELDPPGAGHAVDLSNDTLLAPALQCAVGPCPYLLVDLEDGTSTRWDPEAHVARLGVDGDGRTLLLHDSQGVGNGGSVTVTDPTTGAQRIFRATDPAGQALGLARDGQDSWVPMGWELLVGPGLNVGEAGGPTLMRLADGFLRQLPAPGAG